MVIKERTAALPSLCGEVRNVRSVMVIMFFYAKDAVRLLSLGSGTHGATCHLNLAYNNAGAGNQFQTFVAEL